MAYSPRLVALAIVELLISSCGAPKEGVVDSAAVPAAAQRARLQLPPDPAAVIALAKQYQFAAQPLAPIPATEKIDTTGKNKAVPRSQDPGLTFTRAEEVAGTPYPKDQKVLLRIHAERAYPGLDIAQGENYVWRDVSSPDTAQWTVWLVSEHPARAVQLKRDNHPYSAVDPKRSHLVVQSFEALQTTTSGSAVTVEMMVFGACIDDDICKPSGHCGYSQ